MSDNADNRGASAGDVIGHDGQHLAGAFTTTDVDGYVQFWIIDAEENMRWTDNFGGSGTGHHFVDPQTGKNCIQPGPGEGPAFCFTESRPSKGGRWFAIRDDNGEGVVVQRLSVGDAKK